MSECNNCIYNYNIKPCNLKERVIKLQINCGFYLEKLQTNKNETK